MVDLQSKFECIQHQLCLLFAAIRNVLLKFKVEISQSLSCNGLLEQEILIFAFKETKEI